MRYSLTFLTLPAASADHTVPYVHPFKILPYWSNVKKKKRSTSGCTKYKKTIYSDPHNRTRSGCDPGSMGGVQTTRRNRSRRRNPGDPGEWTWIRLGIGKSGSGVDRTTISQRRRGWPGDLFSWQFLRLHNGSGHQRRWEGPGVRNVLPRPITNRLADNYRARPKGIVENILRS